MCDNGTYAPALRFGSVAWMKNGKPFTASVIETESQTMGSGFLSATPGKLANPDNPKPWQVGSPLILNVAFQPLQPTPEDSDAGLEEDRDSGGEEQGPRWTGRLSIPGDPRAWGVGPVDLAGATVSEHYESNGAIALLNGNPAGVHLVVNQMMGGPADFPSLVTSDFMRMFQLDYTGVPEGLSGNHTELSMTFILTAADFSARHELCGLCK